MGRSSKDKRDIYYRLAKEQGYRARSAFKLLQIDEELNILKDVKKVVDLCAAPGSWSQVLASRLKPEINTDVRIISVDLQAIAPIPGVTLLKGDITDIKTAKSIIENFEGNLADAVICDGAPDVTGLHDLDEYLQTQLVIAALNITTHILKRGGLFVAKIFRGKDTDVLSMQLGLIFDNVIIVKPKSSRHSSVESFIVCRNFSPPDSFIPSMNNPHVDSNWDFDTLDGINRKIVPFISCGDLSGFDSDMSYPLESYDPNITCDRSLDVVQMPIDPPYAHACSLRKQGNLPKDI